jgi:hypothetical protein
MTSKQAALEDAVREAKERVPTMFEVSAQDHIARWTLRHSTTTSS